MGFAFFGIISILICWKWGNWKNWKEYYPTILYFIIGNLVYCILTCDKPLWQFIEFFSKCTFSDISIMILLYPSTVILFLSFLPKTLLKKIMYILLWVIIYTLIELVSLYTGSFAYKNGWNIYFTIIFNIIMFSLLLLHYTNPLIVWPVSAILAFSMMLLFKIPLIR